MKLTKLLKKFLCFSMAAALSLGVMPTITASAAAGYPDVDMFAHVKAMNGNNYIKGVQGAGMDHDINQYTYTDSTGTHGISHSFWNAYLDEMIFKTPVGGAEEFAFEGQTYYFNFSPIEQFIQMCNSQIVTCNIQFMLRWDGSPDKAWLVEPQARVVNPNSAVASWKIYAMDTEGEGRKAFRAFWKALMQWCAARGYHIDQFILGNEVNAPNTWNYFGSLDVDSYTQKYAISFLDMYKAVREYSNVSRCSICLDHTWTWNDMGNAIPAKTFLDSFYKKVIGLNGSDVDWCLSTHIWPAEMQQPSLTWKGFPGKIKNFCVQNANTLLWDASNLNVVTDYIKNNFGAQHRIMMTEQGFVANEGEQVQAAALAYAYYACLYNDMVDQFILHDSDGDGMLAALRPTAQEVYKRLGSADAADQQWISNVCLPVMGKTSWSFIPNFGGSTGSATAPVTPPVTPVVPVIPETPAVPATPETPAAPVAPVTSADVEGLKAAFDAKYYATANPDVKAALGDDAEMMWMHFVNCGLNEGRALNSEFNVLRYKTNYKDLEEAFGNNWGLYLMHWNTCGKAEGRNPGV